MSSTPGNVKEWTSWFWRNLRDCSLPEDKCRYAHKDTGKYAEAPAKHSRTMRERDGAFLTSRLERFASEHPEQTRPDLKIIERQLEGIHIAVTTLRDKIKADRDEVSAPSPSASVVQKPFRPPQTPPSILTASTNSKWRSTTAPPPERPDRRGMSSPATALASQAPVEMAHRPSTEIHNLALFGWDDRKNAGLYIIERQVEVLQDFVHQQLEAHVAQHESEEGSSTGSFQSQVSEQVTGPSPSSVQQPQRMSHAELLAHDISSRVEYEQSHRTHENAQTASTSSVHHLQQLLRENTATRTPANSYFTGYQQPAQRGNVSLPPAKSPSDWHATVEPNPGSSMATDTAGFWEFNVVDRTPEAQSRIPQDAAAPPLPPVPSAQAPTATAVTTDKKDEDSDSEEEKYGQPAP